MQINNISLFNYRNYLEEIATFSPHWNLVFGDNAGGKTNLLEAVHFICLGFSHRTRLDRDLIRWGEKSFILRMEGSLEDPEDIKSQSVSISDKGEKQVIINDKKSFRLSDIIGNFPVVLFSPDDIELINGGPSVRRRFIDTLLCQLSHEYLKKLRFYNRVVKQRNALLKESEKYPQDMLDVLDIQLVESGSAIILKRLVFLKEFFPLVKTHYEEITKTRDEIKFKYRNSTESPSLDLDQQVLKFKEKLLFNRSAEKEIRTTLVGPHRDNLLFFIHNKNAEKFASQGQKRLIAISLKLASAKVVKHNSNRPPILLLDDVFAEIDEMKRKQFSQLIGQDSQVIVASSRKADIPFSVDKEIYIKKGTVLK